MLKEYSEFSSNLSDQPWILILFVADKSRELSISTDPELSISS